MKQSGVFLASVMSGLLVTGCGAILGGSRQTVNVDTDPPASVTVVQTGMTQNTPTTLSLLRKDTYVLTFQKVGYDEKKVEIRRKMRGGILAMDILLTGLLGVVVDAATGSWYKLVPEDITVTLTRKQGSSSDLPEWIEISASLVDAGRTLKVASSQPGVTVRVE